MKQKLLNLWLLAVMLIVGSSGAWAETTTVGKTDNSDAFESAFSKAYAIPADKTLHLEFTNNSSMGENWNNWNLEVFNAERETENVYQYFVLRSDNYAWGDGADTGSNAASWAGHYALSSNYDWTNFKSNYNGAKVAIDITNEAASNRIVTFVTMTSSDGSKTYYEKFVKMQGDLTPVAEIVYAYLTIDKSHLIIDDAKTKVLDNIVIDFEAYGTTKTPNFRDTYSFIDGGDISGLKNNNTQMKMLLDKADGLDMYGRVAFQTGRQHFLRNGNAKALCYTSNDAYLTITDLKAGDAVVFDWIGSNFYFSPSATGKVKGVTTNWQPIISGTKYKMLQDGDMHVQTKKAPSNGIYTNLKKITIIPLSAYQSDYTIIAKCGDLELGTVASGSAVRNEEFTAKGILKGIMKDGKYYIIDETQPGVNGLSYTFTKAVEDETIYLSYKEVAYYADVESLGNTTTGDKEECSGGKYAHVNSDKAASLITLKPGKYTAIGCLAPAADNGRGDRGIYFRNGGVADNTENVIVNCGTNKSSAPGEYTTEEFTLTESTAITLTGYTSDTKTNQSAEIDYVYITRNANLVLPGYYGKAAELTGNVNDDYSITLNGSTLTVSTRKPGYGFQKIKLFTSKFDGVTVSEGRLDDKAVWTGDAEEVVFTLNGSTVNAIAINDAEIPTASVVNNISAFKATDGQSGMKLINADVRAITDEGTVIEDDGAGILLKGIFIPGAAVGKRLTGTIIGIYDPAKKAMVSTELTDCTAPVVNTISGRGAREISNAEALTDVNSFRLVKLNALTIDNGGASVTDNSNNTVKLDNTLFADMATLIDNAASMVSLTGVVYYNGTENVLMPRSASDIVLGSIEQSFADGKAYNPGDEIASSTGVVMTFGGEKSDENVYKFETLDAPVNGYTTGTTGISEGTSYQFDALRNGTLVVTVALEAGKKLSVVCDGEELENDSYQFNGNVITLPVETGKTYIISAVDSNLGLMGYEYQVSDLSAPAVAKNISVFRNMVYGTEAKLMLNDAVVTYIKGDNVFVEDASGAIDFYETQVQFYVGQKLNGYIIGENNVQDNMPVLLRTAATPTSKFTAEKGTAQSKVATVAEALQENNLARFVTLKNLKQAKDKRGFRILIDEVGDTIYIEDRFNVLYEMGNRYSRIEGIIGINAEGTCCIWPTSKDGVVIAGEPATFETGKYYLSNVGATLADENAVWGAGNSWGTQASLVKHPEYVTLHKIADGTYQMETQVSNGGTKYFFNDDNNGNFYMDNGTPTTLTISQSKEPVGYADDEETKPIYGYYIANGESCYGWDGTTTVLAKGIDQSSNNALWIIASEEQAVASLAEAKADNPVDATFLILDPNFGRNNRNQSAWTVSEDCTNKNLSGGNNTNNCAESYMSVFTISQTIDVPNGKYVLNAQAAVTFHDNREIKEYDGNGYPQIFANDKVSNFNDMIVEDRLSNMGKLSEQFTAGMYTVEPIEVIVTDGKLTIGAKSERADIWAIWDNFELTYYGPANADGVLLQLDFENGEAADYWQKGVGYLVTPEFEGTTGQAASIKSGSDRGDYILTEANYAGVEDYNIDLDFAICKGSKTAFFAVMSESSWIFTYTWNNWGYFWKTTTTSDGQVHNPYLFELTIPSGTTAYINEQYDAQETGLANVNGGTWEFTEKNWYHLSLKVKADTKTVGYTVTDKATGAQALNGTYTMRDGESIYMKGIYERNNRVNADPGAILFDNIVVSTGNGPVTAIETVNAETTVRFAEGVYNLRGQKVGDSLQGLPKGLYIVNGKKVVVK